LWIKPTLLGVQVNGDDETIETQDLGEDQDQDHAHEEAWLLGGAPHPGVSDDSDGKARRQSGESHGQSGG